MGKELSEWEQKYGVTYEKDLIDNPYLDFGIFILIQQVESLLYDIDGYDSYDDLYRRSSAGRAVIDSCVSTIKRLEFEIPNDNLDFRIFNRKHFYLSQNIEVSIEDFEDVEDENPTINAITPFPPLTSSVYSDDDDEDFEQEELDNYNNDFSKKREDDIVDESPPYGGDYGYNLTLKEEIELMLQGLNFSGFVTPHKDSSDEKKISDTEFEELKKSIKFISYVESEPQSLTSTNIYDLYSKTLPDERGYDEFILENKLVWVSPKIEEKYDVDYFWDDYERLFFTFEKKTTE